jgi:hypothetical protein
MVAWWKRVRGTVIVGDVAFTVVLVACSEKKDDDCLHGSGCDPTSFCDTNKDCKSPSVCSPIPMAGWKQVQSQPIGCREPDLSGVAGMPDTGTSGTIE